MEGVIWSEIVSFLKKINIQLPLWIVLIIVVITVLCAVKLEKFFEKSGNSKKQKKFKKIKNSPKEKKFIRISHRYFPKCIKINKNLEFRNDGVYFLHYIDNDPDFSNPVIFCNNSKHIYKDNNSFFYCNDCDKCCALGKYHQEFSERLKTLYSDYKLGKLTKNNHIKSQ